MFFFAFGFSSGATNKPFTLLTFRLPKRHFLFHMQIYYQHRVDRSSFAHLGDKNLSTLSRFSFLTEG